MTVTINGTTGISSPGGDTSTSLATTNLSYTGTLTGGTGVIAIGTNQIYKDASGNVGIGVTPSGWTSGAAATLQIKNSGFSGIGNGTHVSSNAYYDGANWRYIAASVVASNCYQSAGAHVWRTTGVTTGTVGSTIAWSTPMTLDASGNLGIGETSPSSYGKLTVTDQATPNGGTLLAVRGGYPGYAGAYGYGLRIYDKDNTTPYFVVGSDYTLTINKFSALGTYTTVLKLDTSGNLLVGSTSAVSGFTNQISSTGSSTNRGCVIVGRTTAATSGVCGSIISYNGSNVVCGFDLQSNGANNSGFIQSYTYSAGVYAQGPYVNTGGTSWTTASDEKLKDISGVIENALEKTASLRAIEYTLKSDPSRMERVGLVAQEVQKVLPQAVSVDPEGYLGVQYTDTIPLLVAAIKELTTRLEALEAKA